MSPYHLGLETMYLYFASLAATIIPEASADWTMYGRLTRLTPMGHCHRKAQFRMISLLTSRFLAYRLAMLL